MMEKSPLPDSLVNAVTEVLSCWHGRGFERKPWSEMLTVAQRLRAQLASGEEMSYEHVVREMLLEALEVLEGRGKSRDAQLLRQRFLDEQIAHSLAQRQNVSMSTFYNRQREAIRSLAQAVWDKELAAMDERANRIFARLEIKHPLLLFGIEHKLEELLSVLKDDTRHWLVCLKGIGGIGKTSLADRGVRDLASTPRFADIGWVNARQEAFAPWEDQADRKSKRPAMSRDELLDELIVQLDLQGIAALPVSQRWGELARLFKDEPYLVVIDNLETVTDYQALIPALLDFANPSKFLITSRHSLHEYPHVYSISLDELSPTDALALIRHEASERGLQELISAADDVLLQVYEVTGGNPLAIKLVVGQVHTLSLPEVLENLREARGHTVEELYRYIYWNAWNVLDEDARQVLVTMPLVAQEGGRRVQIEAVSGLSTERVIGALRRLVTLSLVNVGGSLEERRYGVHRLTESFLAREVVKWQA